MTTGRSDRVALANRALAFAAAVTVLVWGLGATDDKVKIGIVDLEQAITSTTSGKKAREEFDRKQRHAESALIPLREQYQQMGQDFEAKRFVISDDALFAATRSRTSRRRSKPRTSFPPKVTRRMAKKDRRIALTRRSAR